MNPRVDDRKAYHWRAVYNESGEEVPPFGVMMMVGIDIDTGMVSIDKPNRNDLDPAMLLVNGEDSIPSNGEGTGTADGPMLVLYSTAAGIPVNGDSMGTVAGQWDLEKNKVGFLFISEIEDSDDIGFMANRYRALVDVECVDGEIVGQLPELPDVT